MTTRGRMGGWEDGSAGRLVLPFLRTVVAVWCLLPSRASFAQETPASLGDAFELERAGRYGEASGLYKAALRDHPGNLAALLGLERVTEVTGYWDSLLIFVDSALEGDPRNRFIRAVELRTWARIGDADSLEQAAEEWIELEPSSPDPYREWAYAVSQRGDVREAQRVLALGGERLGDDALARELAQLWVATGEWVRATEYWASAVRSDPGQVATAALSLAGTNAAVRPQVIRILTIGADVDPARLVAANLLAQWNRPLEGWIQLEAALPEDPAVALGVLRSFVDRTRRLRTVDAAAARGQALRQIAELTSGTFSEGARLEAARAFAEAGQRDLAEAMLSEVSVDSTVVTPAQAEAMASLIGVMADVGRVEQAEERFRAWQDRLGIEDVLTLRRKISWAWVVAGELERADNVLGADSSLDVMAVKGWISLFRGRLTEATDFFRAAGPMAGTREESTLRTGIMAMIQLVAADSVPELGSALLTLLRGDSARAIAELENAARGLPNDGGRAEVLSLAGRVALASGDFAVSERLLHDALLLAPQSPFAPLTAYSLARLYAQTGRSDRAREGLEELILGYPGSAVVPQARRLLDRLSGMVPQS